MQRNRSRRRCFALAWLALAACAPPASSALDSGTLLPADGSSDAPDASSSEAGARDASGPDGGTDAAAIECPAVPGPSALTMFSGTEPWNLHSAAVQGDDVALAGWRLDGRVVAARWSGGLRWVVSFPTDRRYTEVAGALWATGSQAIAFGADGVLHVARLGSEGRVEWALRVHAHAPWIGASAPRLAVHPSGDLLLAASLDADAFGDPDAILVARFDPAGVVRYQAQLELGHRSIGAIAAAPDGAIVTVTTDQLNERVIETPFGAARMREAWVVRLDDGGAIVWQRALSLATGAVHVLQAIDVRGGELRLGGWVDTDTRRLGWLPWIVDLSMTGDALGGAVLPLPGVGGEIESMRAGTWLGSAFSDVWIARETPGLVEVRTLRVGRLAGDVGTDGAASIVSDLGSCGSPAIPEACGETRRDAMLLNVRAAGPAPCVDGLLRDTTFLAPVPTPLVARPTEVVSSEALTTVESWAAVSSDISVVEEPICFASEPCGVLRASP